MAEFALPPSKSFHIRSISLPCRSHPMVVKAEEELHKLRTSIDGTSSALQKMPDALRELSALYESIEELIQLPCSQQALASLSEKKCLEDEVDGSIKLLDLCSSLKDSLVTKKEHIKDLQSALRRRDIAAFNSKVNANIRSGKTDKDTKNCSRSLKQIVSKCIDMDCNQPTLIRVLMEVQMITISLLQQVFSFLSTQTGRHKSSRWSFVTKALSKRKVAHEEELEDGNGVNTLDLVLTFKCISCNDVDDETTQKFQNQFQKLEVNIEGLENGLESLFRQLIQQRVTLLNILSS